MINTNVSKSKIIRRKSVAYRNVLILLFSLLPFLLGIGYSATKSSSMDYFGVSINISGSQRMRTMLIANYSQQIEDAYNENNTEKLSITREILGSELIKYEDYMKALKDGSVDLELEKNKYENVVAAIVSFEEQYKTYIVNAYLLLEGPVDPLVVDHIVAMALPLKNNVHHVVGLLEQQYTHEMRLLTILDICMIAIAIIVTALGLILTKAIKKNEYFANFDHLTGLLTRFNLYENIRHKNPSEYDVYFIDLNKFKLVNDTYGHAVGDEILKEAANRLISVFGKENTYRYGGDEFVVLSNDEVKEIEQLTLELSNRFALPIIDSKFREHFISLSIGAVKRGVGPHDWDKLIHFADELMYDAKSFVGHTVICDTNEAAKKRLNIDYAVLEGLEKIEFTPHFQPIYNVTDEELVMQMVLCRWHQSNTNFIMPSEFLPVLKRKGLLVSFDLYMIKQLNDMYEEMNDIEKEYIYSINLTEETLLGARSNNLLETIRSISIPHEKLVFKFMENVLLNDELLGILELIFDMGYKLAVDNFTIDISLKESAKYSNISIVKLGMVTIKSMMIDNYARKVLKEFIHMLVSIDKIVIVEGIEAIDEIELLKEINQSIKGRLYYSTPYKLKTFEELSDKKQ